MPMSTRAWLWACVVDSAGIRYVRNRLKLVFQSAAAAESGVDVRGGIEDRFGTLLVGQTIIGEAQVFSGLTGQVSGRNRAQVVVTST